MWLDEKGAPPNLRPVLGLRLTRAWILNRRILMMRLEGGRAVAARANPCPRRARHMRSK